MPSYFSPSNLPEQWSFNGEPAASYILYAFSSGASTTPQNMFSDSSGTVAGTTVTLDSQGYTSTSGTRHPIWLDDSINYRLELRADDATTVIWQADDVSFTSINSLLRGSYWVDSYASLRAKTSADYVDGDVVTITNDGIAGDFVIKTGTVTDNGGTLIVFSDDSERYAERIFDGMYNVLWFGANGDDDSIDQTTAIQACIDACDLDGVESNYHNKAVFIPTPLSGYRVTGLDAHQRVGIIGEDKWNCRLVVSAQGDYGIENPRRVSNIFFDGVAIQNGANRIDQAGWSRATDRANTGVIMGPADQAFQGGHGIVEECRFASLGVCVERGDCIDTTVRNNYMISCWHGIFSRADGSKAFASMLYDVKNYISQNSGIAIGFYINANGYSQWSCEGNVCEVCCTDAAHNGINGFIDSGGASLITPGARQLYIEGDESVYPNSIGIRSNIFNADGFVIQGTGTPLKVSGGSNSFWRLTNGQIFETVDTYDITFPTGGRNLCMNVSFSNGLNPAGIGNTTLIDCSATGVLPDSNTNHHIDDGGHYVGNQGGISYVANRRSSNGNVMQWMRQGLPAQELEVTISSTSVLDSGTTDGASANKLVDSSQNFTATVSVGLYVKNTTDDTFAIVTAVDSDTTLSLDSDIMSSSEDYQIFNIPVSRFTRPMGFDRLTVSELNKYPASVHAGCVVMITDETGGYTLAFSNGANWVRCQDLSTVS